MAEQASAGQALDARGDDLNAQIRYTMWSVYRVVPGEPAAAHAACRPSCAPSAGTWSCAARTTSAACGRDADLMLWWHAPSAEALQAAYRTVGEIVETRLAPVWSQMGLHRPAEFNRAHVPAFLAGEPAGRLAVRVPVRPLLRVVPAAGVGASRAARGARSDGP